MVCPLINFNQTPFAVCLTLTFLKKTKIGLTYFFYISNPARYLRMDSPIFDVVLPIHKNWLLFTLSCSVVRILHFLPGFNGCMSNSVCDNNIEWSSEHPYGHTLRGQKAKAIDTLPKIWIAKQKQWVIRSWSNAAGWTIIELLCLSIQLLLTYQ